MHAGIPAGAAAARSLQSRAPLSPAHARRRRAGGVAEARMRARRRRPSPARQRGSVRRRRKERRRPAGTCEGAGGKRRRSLGLGRAGPGSVRLGRTGPRPGPLRRPLPAAPVPRAPSVPRRRLPAVPLSGASPQGRSVRHGVRRGPVCLPPLPLSAGRRGAACCGGSGVSARAARRSGLCATRSVRAPLVAGAFRGGVGSETYRDRGLSWIAGEGEIAVHSVARCVKLNAAPRGFRGARARPQLEPSFWHAPRPAQPIEEMASPCKTYRDTQSVLRFAYPWFCCCVGIRAVASVSACSGKTCR